MITRDTLLRTQWCRMCVLVIIVGVVICNSAQQVFAAIKSAANSRVRMEYFDDRDDPNVSWTTGSYTIYAGTHVFNWDEEEWDSQSSGTHLKSGLPNTAPDFNQFVPGSGAQYANAFSEIDGSQARGTGTAYLDEFLIYEYELNAEAKIWCKGFGDWASAGIVDPIVMEWNDSESHTLVFTLTLKPGSTRSANSSFKWESKLDFDNNGTFDQLFWCLEIGTDPNAPDQVNLTLGNDVVLGGGKSKSQIESELNAMSNGSNWVVTTDYVIEFLYTVSAGAPGAVGISVNGEADGALMAGSIPVGDWEMSFDHWTISWGDAMLGFSGTGATLNDKSLKVVAPAGGWASAIFLKLQDPGVDLMDWFIGPCGPLTFEIDITRLVGEWIEDYDTGTYPYSALKFVLNAGGSNDANEWNWVWKDCGDFGMWDTWMGDQTIHCFVDWDLFTAAKAAAQAIFDAGFIHDRYVEIYLIPINSGYESPVIYYLDNARLLYGGDYSPPMPGDINKDGYVDFKDFAELAGNWLECNNINDPNCIWEP